MHFSQWYFGGLFCLYPYRKVESDRKWVGRERWGRIGKFPWVATSSHRVYGMTWATEPGCPLVTNLQSDLDLTKPSCLFKRLIMFNSRCKVWKGYQVTFILISPFVSCLFSQWRLYGQHKFMRWHLYRNTKVLLAKFNRITGGISIIHVCNSIQTHSLFKLAE